jgi:hypothetical protein
MNPFSSEEVENVFSIFLGCLFNLAIVSFDVQSLFFYHPICQFFLLFPNLLESYSEAVAYTHVLKYLPSVSFGIFKFSGLTLSTLIHFELIFVQGEK